MPSVWQPHSTHSQIKGWQQHDALNLSTNHPFITCIPFPRWQDPDENQKPIPLTWTIGEGASPPRETTQIQKLHGGNGRRGRGSHQCAALWDPWQPQLQQSCAEMLLHYHWRWKTDTHIHAKTCFPSALISAWPYVREAALPKGKLVAFWSSQRHHGGTLCSYTQPDGPSGPHRYTAMSQRSLPKSVTGRIFLVTNK